MSNPRLILAILIMVLIPLYWGFKISPNERQTIKTEYINTDESFFAKDSTIKSYDNDGKLIQTLQVKRLAYYPNQQLKKLSEPRFTLTDSNHAKTFIKAQQGILPNNQETALLKGNVQVIDTSDTGVKTQILTEQLTLYPKGNAAETDQPVTILSDQISYQAVGMKVSFETDQLDLLSDIEGSHDYE